MTAQAVAPGDVDVSVVFYREDGRWTAAALPARGAVTLNGLSDALRRFPGEGGVFGGVAVGDDFFVLVRESGANRSVVLSDAASTLDWSLAQEAAEFLGFDEEDPDEYEPIGDLAMLQDLGVGADTVVEICQDEELYPDEQLAAIADRLGCGAEWRAALDDAQ